MNTMTPPPGSGPIEKPVTRRVMQPAAAPPQPDTVNEVDQPDEVRQVAPPEPEWPLKIPLKKPIKIKNVQNGDIIQQYDVVEMREPIAADIIAAGVPVIVIDYEEGVTTFDAQKMASMISRLSKIPLPYITAMDPVDFINCATMLQRNFLPDLERML